MTDSEIGSTYHDQQKPPAAAGVKNSTPEANHGTLHFISIFLKGECQLCATESVIETTN